MGKKENKEKETKVNKLTQKNQYVYRLMKATCSHSNGDFEQNLNLPKDHGVVFNESEYPLMNANDHEPDQHITTFGRCNSMKNPNAYKGTLNGIIPIITAITQPFIGCKCRPMTLVPWINVDEDYFIDGAPALTIESELPCYYGGTIKIVLKKEEENSESEDDTSQEEQEERDVTDFMTDAVKEKVAGFCDEEAIEIQSAADTAVQNEAAALEAFDSTGTVGDSNAVEISFEADDDAEEVYYGPIMINKCIINTNDSTIESVHNHYIDLNE